MPINCLAPDRSTDEKARSQRFDSRAPCIKFNASLTRGILSHVFLSRGVSRDSRGAFASTRRSNEMELVRKVPWNIFNVSATLFTPRKHGTRFISRRSDTVDPIHSNGVVLGRALCNRWNKNSLPIFDVLLFRALGYQKGKNFLEDTINLVDYVKADLERALFLEIKIPYALSTYFGCVHLATQKERIFENLLSI